MSDQTNEEILERIKWAEENREKLPHIKQKFPPRLIVVFTPGGLPDAWVFDLNLVGDIYLSDDEHKTLLEQAKREARAEAFEELAAIFSAEAEKFNRQYRQTNDLGAGIAYAGQRGAAMLCETKAASARASADPEGGEKFQQQTKEKYGK